MPTLKTFYLIINSHLEGFIDGKTVYHQILDVQMASTATVAKTRFFKGIGNLFVGKTVFASQPDRYHSRFMVVDRNGNEMEVGTLTQQGCPYYVVLKQSRVSSTQHDWVDKFLDSGKLHKATVRKRLQRPEW